jgi:7-carboxy-7-deazaguanine synthase
MSLFRQRLAQLGGHHTTAPVRGEANHSNVHRVNVRINGSKQDDRPGIALQSAQHSTQFAAYLCTMDRKSAGQVSDSALFVEGKQLPVMEQFYTIQGEGFHSGKAAYFIRIGGCDVGCHWCDVKESWDAALHPLTDTDEIVKNALASGSDSVVITGGEPLMYQLDLLTSQLKRSGMKTFLETSGAYPLSGEWDWICLSPKKTMPPDEQILKKANELKVIIYNHHDFTWAEKHAADVGEDCCLFLQPEWSRMKKILPDIIDYVQKNTKWMVSLQIHKFMGIP